MSEVQVVVGRVHDGIGGTLSNGFGGARMPLTQPFDDRQECLSHRIGVVVPPKASCTPVGIQSSVNTILISGCFCEPFRGLAH